ncbi:MAG: aminotransferase class IV family protein [Pseudomonadota bacterium]
MEEPLRPVAGDHLKLIETFRAEDGYMSRIDRHLARMARGAAQLAFAFDRQRVERALEAVPPQGSWRVRVTMSVDGTVEVTTTEFKEIAPPWQVGLAAPRLDSADPWLSVKSTRRAVYDTARQNLPAGIDEVVFLNERGEVCEGTITNVFVEIEGGLLTPPRRSGLLPGILREELLADGHCREQVLFPDDLHQAARLYCGNSLRGLIPSVLPPSSR